MHFLDTNVVLRLFNPAALEHEVVRRALEVLDSSGERLVIGLQVLVEAWVVATRPAQNNGFGWALEVAEAALEVTRQRFDVLVEDGTTVARWAQIVRERSVRGKRAHDARIVALMQTHGVSHILTLNTQDFLAMPSIIAVHPQAIAG
jgi:predicted nucleic acid-binding protein